MSYQVFARKYRPETFKDVLGQDHVIQTLRNAIEQNRLAHAYLFVGPRGTGKTTTARILAKALNCPDGPNADFDPESPICKEIANGSSLDVIEIDGASNNGVDHIRDLRENVQYSPTNGKFKIYYIDEVHMLSTSAFNALLKTLEEPPAHVKFIFATTEPNKILPTIISRCQRFDLRPIDTQTIADQLTYISNNEGVTLDPAAAWAVAKGADGGMRDAQSMLDQLVAFCGAHIKESHVLDVFGFTSRETVAQFTQHILTKKTSEALTILNQQSIAGKELGQLLDDTIGCLRTLLVSKVDTNASNDGIPEALWSALTKTGATVPVDRLLNLVDIFAETEARMKWASNKKLHLEIGVIKAIQSLNDVRISDVITALAGAGALPPTDQLASAGAPAAPDLTQPATTTRAETPEPAPAAQTETPPVISQPAASAAPEPVAAKIDLQPQPAAQPTGPMLNPEPTAPAAEKLPPLKRKTTKETINSLDAFIDSAPEISDAPPMLEPDDLSKPATTTAPQKDEAPQTDASAAKAENDNEFYKDPLIVKALEIFEATLQTA